MNVDGTLSHMAEAISGVSQVSVIDPIQFVIYGIDLPDHLSADSPLYVNGVKLLTSLNRHEILQGSLNVGASWPKDWELDLNPTKSEHLPIGNSHHFSFTPFRPQPTQHPDNPNSFHNQRPGNCLKHQAQC